jgi:hypothetical protein
MKELALPAEQRLSNNKEAYSRGQQELVQKPTAYRIPTAKKFFAHPIKIAIFRVDMGVNVEYNVRNCCMRGNCANRMV